MGYFRCHRLPGLSTYSTSASDSAVTYRLYSDGEAGQAVLNGSFDHAVVCVSVNGEEAAVLTLNGTETVTVPVTAGEDSLLTVACCSGAFVLETVHWEKA